MWKHIENVLELQCNVGATLFENGLKTPGHLLQCHPCEMMELYDKMRLKDWDRLQLDNFIGFMEWYRIIGVSDEGDQWRYRNKVPTSIAAWKTLVTMLGEKCFIE